jgi:hypothetical protein
VVLGDDRMILVEAHWNAAAGFLMLLANSGGVAGAGLRRVNVRVRLLAGQQA